MRSMSKSEYLEMMDFVKKSHQIIDVLIIEVVVSVCLVKISLFLGCVLIYVSLVDFIYENDFPCIVTEGDLEVLIKKPGGQA